MMNSILSAINSIFLKQNIVIFNSFPDCSGNSLALYEYILKNRTDICKKYKLIWAVNEMNTNTVLEFLKARTCNNNHIIVSKKSIRGIYLFLSAKYIISTHGYFPLVKTAKSQLHINLWHGMPFKRIGRMLESVHTNGKSDEADMTIATSNIFQEIMARSFGISKDKVLVTGQPCNDAFFSKVNALKELGINKNEYKRIIMWLPTYRTSVVGDIRHDGNENSFGVLDVMKNYFHKLDKCLKNNGYLLLIKPHPMDAICNLRFQESKNIKVIFNKDISEKKLNLYEVLSDCDLLLTDYSSVFIDFLVTGKPMAFVCNDLNEYSGTRGFCFDKPREYMPGQPIKSFDELIDYLNDLETINDNWRKRYLEVQQELNSLCDGKACERVCNQIWGLNI